jgi:hypothetical protein
MLATPLRRLALALALIASARTASADPPPTAAPAQPSTPLLPPGTPVTPPGYPGGVPPSSTPGTVPPGYGVPPGYTSAPGYGVPSYYGAAGPPGYYPSPSARPATPQIDPYFLPPLPPRRRYDTKLFVGGVTSVIAGMVTVLVGAYLVSSAANSIPIYCDTPSFPCAFKTDTPLLTGGALMMAAGALVGAAGIPMWIIGSQYVTVPKDEKKSALVPELHVGAGSASVSLRF